MSSPSEVRHLAAAWALDCQRDPDQVHRARADDVYRNPRRHEEYEQVKRALEFVIRVLSQVTDREGAAGAYERLEREARRLASVGRWPPDPGGHGATRRPFPVPLCPDPTSDWRGNAVELLRVWIREDDLPRLY